MFLECEISIHNGLNKFPFHATAYHQNPQHPPPCSHSHTSIIYHHLSLSINLRGRCACRSIATPDGPCPASNQSRPACMIVGPHHVHLSLFSFLLLLICCRRPRRSRPHDHRRRREPVFRFRGTTNRSWRFTLFMLMMAGR